MSKIGIDNTADEPYFVNSQGKRIVCKDWIPELDDGDKPRALVLLIHGLTWHYRIYEELAQWLLKEKFLPFAHDLVGHGRSDGDKHIEDFLSYAHDCVQHIGIMTKRYPGVPVYVLGHSMGGPIAVQTADLLPNLSGLILLSPGITPTTQRPAWKNRLLLCFCSKQKYDLTPANSYIDAVDPEFARAYTEDTLHDSIVTVGLTVRLAYAGKDILAHAGRLKVPYILQQGEADTVLVIEDAKAFHQRTASTDKTLMMYDGVGHQILHGVKEIREPIMQDIIDWLLARV